MTLLLRMLMLGALCCAGLLSSAPVPASGETGASDYVPTSSELASLLNSLTVTTESTNDTDWEQSLQYMRPDSDIEVYVSASVLPDTAGAHQFFSDRLTGLQANNELSDIRTDFTAKDYAADELTQLHLIYEGEDADDRVGEYALLVRYGRVVALVEGVSSPEADDRNVVDNDRSLAVLKTFGLVTGKIQYSPADGPQPVPGVKPFTRDWSGHGLSLAVDENGHGEMTWRVSRLCSDNPTPPCDEIINNEIHSGGSATLIIYRVESDTALGSVVKSTDTDTLKLGPMTLQMGTHGMIQLRHGDTLTELCGPDPFKPGRLLPGAESPCGA